MRHRAQLELRPPLQPQPVLPHVLTLNPRQEHAPHERDQVVPHPLGHDPPPLRGALRPDVARLPPLRSLRHRHPLTLGLERSPTLPGLLGPLLRLLEICPERDVPLATITVRPQVLASRPFRLNMPAGNFGMSALLSVGPMPTGDANLSGPTRRRRAHPFCDPATFHPGVLSSLFTFTLACYSQGRLLPA